MVFEYDDEVDALFIWFKEDVDFNGTTIEGEIWPKEAKEHIGMLFDQNKKLIGLEILFASNYIDLGYILSKSRT